jgi:hypothetical protein
VLHHLYVRTWCPYECVSYSCYYFAVSHLIDELLFIHYKLKERTVKWTHEPRYTFYHKKHLYLAFMLFFICCTILIENTKMFIFIICIEKKTINPLKFLFSYYILSSFTRFIFTCVLFSYTKLCALDNHNGGVGDTRLLFYFAWLLQEEGKEYSLLSSPRVRYNPGVTLVEKILWCRNTLHLESQHHQWIIVVTS